MKTYILRHPEFPWGDYGAILLSGMMGHLSRENGLLQLERTGPFVPPLSLPGRGAIVVTESFRTQLEASGLTGFTFRPVIKKHIVYLEWEKWDREAEDPQMYPETGEPEDYILGQPHSPSLAAEMESVWELVLEQSALVKRVKVGPRSWDESIHLVMSSLKGNDFFKAEGVGYNYVTEKAKQWLEKNVPEWVTFEEALTDEQVPEEWKEVPTSLNDELRELVRQGKVISATMAYQSKTGCSLVDARRYIDSL